MDPTSEALLRAVFKYMNKLMLSMWRLGLGRFLNSPNVGYIMVLTTTGHRSGLRRRAPVNFAQDPGVVYCLAGFGEKTHWYRNLMADPHCEVWLPDGWWNGVAEPVTNQEDRLPILRRVLIRSGFAARLFEGIDPAALSETELREFDVRYKIMRIRLTAERSGQGGPGDLTWVWPVLGMAAVGVWLWRRRRK